MVELRARKGLMIKIHMIGKTNPGGVHVGMLRVVALLASSLVSPRGRAFDIGLKILERMFVRGHRKKTQGKKKERQNTDIKRERGKNRNEWELN